MVEDIVIGIIALMVIGAPALAISARIALRPLAEAIARMREAFPKEDGSISDARLAALEDEVRALRIALEHRIELRGFDSELASRPRPRAGLSSAAPTEGDPDRE